MSAQTGTTIAPVYLPLVPCSSGPITDSPHKHSTFITASKNHWAVILASGRRDRNHLNEGFQ